jgi:hypothetical protein
MNAQTNKITLQKTIIKDFEEDDCEEEEEDETNETSQIKINYGPQIELYEAY